MKKLSKYKIKHEVKELLGRIVESCKEDNLSKFQYAFSKLFKITFNTNVTNVTNVTNIIFNSNSYQKITEFVYDVIVTYKPHNISILYKEELEKAVQEFNKHDENKTNS